jgi:uncharacterized membrane protein
MKKNKKQEQREYAVLTLLALIAGLLLIDALRTTVSFSLPFNGGLFETSRKVWVWEVK